MPFKSTLPCFALVAALFATTAAKAVTRYVAPCGNDAWAGVNVNCVAPLGPKRTIQAAINASANGDSVMVLPGTYMETIDLDGKAITLNGAAGYATTIIDGGGDGPVVLCNSLEGAGTVIQGFTIRNGHSDQHGGGLFMALASPTISNCRFQNNTADSSGGGVYGVTSSATLTDCIFTGNQADQGAGAWFQYGAPTIDGCTFTANESSLHGGGLELHVVNDAEVVDCTFSSNSVESGGDGGGALHISSCAPTLTNCNFTNNTAPFGGGAISCANSNGAALSGCTFTDNSSFGCCGASAMACENSTVSLLGCNFTGNWVSQYGGAIVADSSSITMALCGFHENQALDWIAYGAAIWLADNSSLDAGLCTFTDNQAGGGSGGGGGAVYGNESAASFEGCTFDGNLTFGTGGGGAIRMEHGTLVLDSCTFDSNSAGKGGAVYLLSMSGVGILDTTFSGNGASGDGGAVYLEDCPVSIQNSEFSGNDAGNAGGAIFTGSLLITPNAQDPLNILNSEFQANHADVTGGALCAGTPTNVVGCLFQSNTSQDGGAAVGVASFADMRFHSCRFDGNQATGVAGALMVGAMSSGSKLLLVNSIVSNNTSSFGGGAIHESVLGGLTQVVNCAVVGNAGGGLIIANGATQSKVSNTVLWGNHNGATIGGSQQPLVRFSNVQGGYAGTGNLNANPLFVNAAVGNYAPAPGSPCIDAGATWALPIDVLDLDGDADTAELVPLDYNGAPRLSDNPATAGAACGGLARVDIGPIESLGETLEDLHPGDVNGDGVVDVNDLLAVITTWGPCPAACCAADFDVNGNIDVNDLLTVIVNWG